MKLTDILPLDAWVSREKDASEKFGLNAAAFDAEGFRITDYVRRANGLCPAIKKVADGRTRIRARSRQDIAGRAVHGRAPVIDACEAGMAKIVVPIFVENGFVGTFSGCGLPFEGEDVDGFYVNKITGIPEDEIGDLTEETARLSEKEAEALAAHPAGRVKEIVADLGD